VEWVDDSVDFVGNNIEQGPGWEKIVVFAKFVQLCACERDRNEKNKTKWQSIYDGLV